MGCFSPEYVIDVSRLRQVSRHWGKALPSTFPRDRFPTPGSWRGRWDPNVHYNLHTPSPGSQGIPGDSPQTCPQWGTEGDLSMGQNWSGNVRVWFEKVGFGLLFLGNLGLSNFHPLFLGMVGKRSS